MFTSNSSLFLILPPPSPPIRFLTRPTLQGRLHWQRADGCWRGQHHCSWTHQRVIKLFLFFVSRERGGCKLSTITEILPPAQAPSPNKPTNSQTKLTGPPPPLHILWSITQQYSYDKGIGAISTLMHFYGRDTVPLGSYKGPWARNPNAPGAKGSADRYISDLVEHYPSPVKNYSQVRTTVLRPFIIAPTQCLSRLRSACQRLLNMLDYTTAIRASKVPDAVSVYRKALAGQADNSVAIASIGITTNMRDLVLSSPDQYSKLNGHDLVAQKVNRVVWMDGMYNFGCAQHDSDNWLGPDTDCRGSAQAAVQGW